MSDTPTLPDENRYKERGYSSAEVEILLKLQNVQIELHQLKENSVNYIRREEFAPVQKLVYGMVGVILLAFLTALLTLVVMK